MFLWWSSFTEGEMVNFGSHSNCEQHPYILMSRWGACIFYVPKQKLFTQWVKLFAVWGFWSHLWRWLSCSLCGRINWTEYLPGNCIQPNRAFHRILLEGKLATEVPLNTWDDGRKEQTKFLWSTILQVTESNLQTSEKCQGKERQQGPSSSESICEKLYSPDGWNGFHIHCTCSLVFAISSAVLLLIYGSYSPHQCMSMFPIPINKSYVFVSRGRGFCLVPKQLLTGLFSSHTWFCSALLTCVFFVLSFLDFYILGNKC